MTAVAGRDPVPIPDLPAALLQIAATAAERDRIPVPPFPGDALDLLEAAGVLAWNAVPGRRRPPAAEELEIVRAVARADASVGRILDGHLNGVERLAVQAPREVRDAELALVRAGQLRVGVWGGDPRPGEGRPATIDSRFAANICSAVSPRQSCVSAVHPTRCNP